MIDSVQCLLLREYKILIFIYTYNHINSFINILLFVLYKKPNIQAAIVNPFYISFIKLVKESTYWKTKSGTLVHMASKYESRAE